MTLSLALIHTPIPPSLSPVKYISPFIGSFLSLLSQGPCCLTSAREGEGRGQVGQWRNGVKLTKTDEKSKIKTAVGRSWTLKATRLYEWLFLLGMDVSSSREAEWEGEEKEGRKEARQEETITSSCDLVSVQCSSPFNVPVSGHLSMTYRERCQEAQGEKHL